MSEMLLKVNHSAIDKAKHLGFDKSRGDPSNHVWQILHNLFSNDYLHSSFIQFFFICLLA